MKEKSKNLTAGLIYDIIDQGSPVAFQIYDENGTMTKFNDIFVNMLGINNTEEILKYNFFDDPNIPDDFKEKLKNGETIHYTVEYDFSRDNRTSTFDLDRKGKVCLDVAFAPIFSKIPSKQKNRELKQKINGYFALMCEKAESAKFEEEKIQAEKLESIGTLAGEIAHDFNNILTAILGNINLAKLVNDPVNKSIYLEEAENAISKAKLLTNKLLTFSKGGNPIKSEISFKEFMHFFLKNQQKFSQFEYNINIPNDLWYVIGDQNQLIQVFSSIISNAHEAMLDGGIILIKAENYIAHHENSYSLEPGRYLKISVSDSGIGIADGEISRIFDPFYTTKPDKLGLGLTIAHSIILNHNGNIYASSNPGKGTTVHFFMPANGLVHQDNADMRKSHQ